MRRVVAIGLAVALVGLSAPTAYAYSDGDSDKVEDEHDNCVGFANPFQFDTDGDGRGDDCEQPLPLSDDFAGSDGSDVMFGSFRPSVLAGGGGPDGLYGLGGDDILDGGPGSDTLVGGPGDDRVTGGSGCDIFGIDVGIDQRDVITDFEPGIDRVRFPPRSRITSQVHPPRAITGGTQNLEVRFEVDDLPAAVVVFEGVRPGSRLVLSTAPCNDQPPPSSVCPAPGAWRQMVFVGFEDLFCPGRGGLSVGIGVYQPPLRKLIAVGLRRAP